MHATELNRNRVTIGPIDHWFHVCPFKPICPLLLANLQPPLLNSIWWWQLIGWQTNDNTSHAHYILTYSNVMQILFDTRWSIVCVVTYHPLSVRLDTFSIIFFVGLLSALNDRLPWAIFPFLSLSFSPSLSLSLADNCSLINSSIKILRYDFIISCEGLKSNERKHYRNVVFEKKK